MKILVTGFDPFGGETVNPAIESVRRLPDEIEGAEIIKLEVPTVVGKSIRVIRDAIIRYDPDVILSVGQAGGRSMISVERIGINVTDCRIPDNEGNAPTDEPVFEDGPDAYFSTLPIRAMTAEIRGEGIPAAVSNSAGTFVCNHVMYGVSYLCAHEFAGKRSGFIHIPFMPEQTADKPNYASMELGTIVRGLTAALRAIVKYDKDIRAGEGALH